MSLFLLCILLCSKHGECLFILILSTLRAYYEISQRAERLILEIYFSLSVLTVLFFP